MQWAQCRKEFMLGGSRADAQGPACSLPVPPEQSRSMCFIWCFVASKLSPGLLQTLGISSRCADRQLQNLFWLRYRPEFRRAGVKGELCSAL